MDGWMDGWMVLPFSETPTWVQLSCRWPPKRSSHACMYKKHGQCMSVLALLLWLFLLLLLLILASGVLRLPYPPSTVCHGIL